MKARLPKGYGGPSDMGALARQAQKMQEQMAETTAQLEETTYTATAGGNAVEATVKGTMEVTEIKLQPEVVDPEDVDMLADLVVAAVNGALRKAAEDKEAKMNAITGSLNFPGMF